MVSSSRQSRGGALVTDADQKRFQEALVRLTAERETMLGEEVVCSFRVYAPFIGERLACDDWEGWEIAGITLETDAGSRVVAGGGLRLTGPVTALPTFLARSGELVTYRVLRVGDRSKQFDGRVYGYLTWSEEVAARAEEQGVGLVESASSPYATEIDMGDR